MDKKIPTWWCRGNGYANTILACRKYPYKETAVYGCCLPLTTEPLSLAVKVMSLLKVTLLLLAFSVSECLRFKVFLTGDCSSYVFHHLWYTPPPPSSLRLVWCAGMFKSGPPSLNGWVQGSLALYFQLDSLPPEQNIRFLYLLASVSVQSNYLEMGRNEFNIRISQLPVCGTFKVWRHLSTVKGNCQTASPCTEFSLPSPAQLRPAQQLSLPSPVQAWVGSVDAGVLMSPLGFCALPCGFSTPCHLFF